jgi:hypothetical protein
MSTNEQKPEHKGRHVFTPEEKTRGAEASARKRRERALQGATPQDLDSEVIKGLRDAAKRGSAPAARELREWLARNPAQVDVASLHHKAPADLTPDELEELRAWALLQYWQERGLEDGVSYAEQSDRMVEPEEKR